jgi:hypothetical protein
MLRNLTVEQSRFITLFEAIKNQLQKRIQSVIRDRIFVLEGYKNEVERLEMQNAQMKHLNTKQISWALYI